MLVREFLAKNKTVIMPSTDLAPADFFLFPKMKTLMKRKCFTTIEEIKEKSKQELLAITNIAFQKYFENWKGAGICVLYLTGVTLRETR